MERSSHKVIIGRSGSGKTSGIMIPEIKKMIKDGNSFLVTDSGNEIMEYLGDDFRSQEYKVVILNLRDRSKSDRWNPLLMPYEAYKNGDYDRAYSLLSDIANSIFFTISDRKDDPFWDISSRDLFTGLAFGLFEDANSIEEINIKSIYNMEISGNKKVAGGTTLLSEYYESKTDKFGYTVSGLRGTVIAPSDTKSSILSAFNQKLRNVTLSDKYMPILCDSTFDMEECINGKTAFILQFEDERDSSSYIINVFIKQIYEIIIEMYSLKPQSESKRFGIFLDDFLCLSYFPYLDKLLMGAARRNVELCFSINSFSLLKRLYGDYLSNALLENCNQLIITDIADVELLKYLSSLKEYGHVSYQYISKSIRQHEYILIDKKNGVKCQNMDYCEKTNVDNNDMNSGNFRREIKCFDFEKFVMDQREIRLKEKNRNAINIDDLINRIDKKIQELEQEEKKFR